MRFLTTLLPLFTLAVHVAATSHDSIPLHDLPPPTYPEAVHPVHQGHDEPPPYTEAPGSNNPMPPAYLPPISTSFHSHGPQPPVRMPPGCEDALRRQAFARAIQLTPEHQSNLEVVVDYAKNLSDHGMAYLLCAAVIVTGAVVVAAVVLAHYPGSGCHSKTCTSSHRRNLDKTLQPQKCERWDIKACKSDTSLTAKHPSQSVVSKVASRGPGKRDAGRMSYRRRLELV
ncbi:uncharacterized protein C8R40DRAFT_1241121 [Lentinula edodes]|uniref:uncharacterized protein n=1 Tax=Lentinula edodes TaxID=5353 RepID=UPI001E8EBC6D|nr:uncharacterized protein C8R40DRAFT_1241121 [Lentinula edodes]KAH7869314.1 hypothetical protein C8R40DRAFT_1241121 [Lentinula edodes]